MLVAINPPLPLVHEAHGLLSILPLGLLDVLQTVTVCHWEVLAQDLNVVDRFTRVVVDVLLYRQNCFVFVRVLQFLRQRGHHEVGVFVLEVQQLELEVNVGAGLFCVFALLVFFAAAVELALGHFTFGHSLLVHLLE